MKRIFFALTILIAFVTLSSFVMDNHHSPMTEMGNDFIYFTSTTAWRTATDSETIYIFYKEGNGVRSYYMSCDRNPDFYYNIRSNSCYRQKNCNDYRRNYRYQAVGCGGFTWLFNANLPYRKEPDSIY